MARRRKTISRNPFYSSFQLIHCLLFPLFQTTGKQASRQAGKGGGRFSHLRQIADKRCFVEPTTSQSTRPPQAGLGGARGKQEAGGRDGGTEGGREGGREPERKKYSLKELTTEMERDAQEEDAREEQFAYAASDVFSM